MGEKTAEITPIGPKLLRELLYVFVMFIAWSTFSYYFIGTTGKNPLWIYLFDFLFLAFVLISFFCMPLFALVSLLRKQWRKARSYCIYGLSMFLFALLFIQANRTVEGWALRRYVRPVDEVIDAISRFESEKGHAPPSLKALCPQYLEAIPNIPLTYSDENGKWFIQVPVEKSFFSSEFMLRGAQVNKQSVSQLFGYGDDPENLVLVEPIGDWSFVHLSMP